MEESLILECEAAEVREVLRKRRSKGRRVAGSRISD